MAATTNYIWDEENYLAEANGSNVVTVVYTNEPQQYGNLISSRLSNSTFYHNFDATGSTRQLTNAVAAITDTVTYDAWGIIVNRVGTTVIAFLWVGDAGYYADSETGGLHVRRRQYSPATSRWGSLDPVLIYAIDGPYTYSANSPLSFSDPSGMLCCVVDKFAVTGPGDCSVKPSTYPGNLLVYTVGAPFAIDAEFKTSPRGEQGGDSPKCRCCEYRQYIMKTQFRLRWRQLNNGKLKVAGGWSDLLKGTPDTTFSEDSMTIRDATTGKEITRNAGHRTDRNLSGKDEYMPNRQGGCIYRLTDAPGRDMSLSDNTRLHADRLFAEIQYEMKFQGRIINGCADPTEPRQIDLVTGLSWKVTCCIVFGIRNGKLYTAMPEELVPACGG